MTCKEKQLCMNRFRLPQDMIRIIKDFAFQDMSTRTEKYKERRRRTVSEIQSNLVLRCILKLRSSNLFSFTNTLREQMMIYYPNKKILPVDLCENYCNHCGEYEKGHIKNYDHFPICKC